MYKIIKWCIKLVNGDECIIDSEDYDKLMRSITTRGSNLPKWQTKDKDWIFLSHIVAVQPVEREEIIQEPIPSVEECTDEEPITLTQDELLYKMKELSSCVHDKTTMYKKYTKTGVKFFTVCDKCNRKSRFVKADDVNDPDSVPEWIEKD